MDRDGSFLRCNHEITPNQHPWWKCLDLWFRRKYSIHEEICWAARCSCWLQTRAYEASLHLRKTYCSLFDAQLPRQPSCQIRVLRIHVGWQPFDGSSIWTQCHNQKRLPSRRNLGTYLFQVRVHSWFPWYWAYGLWCSSRFPTSLRAQGI